MLFSRAIVIMTAVVLGMPVALAQQGGVEPEVSSAELRRRQIDAHAQATIDGLVETSAAAAELFEQAAGYAAFKATKAGFFVTGGAGTGVAVNRQSGERTYMRMGTGGIGLGIGAQRYDIVVLFETDYDLARFTSGGWDASASAHASAGKDGVTVTSSFIDGIAFYQLTDKGLMAQADVSGTRFWVIDDLNRATP